MRERPEDDPETWVCEDCPSNRIPSSIFVQGKQPSGMRFSLNRPPKKSKVQYIEPEEAMGLASGVLRNNSSSPSKHCPNRFPMKKPLLSKMKACPSNTPPPKSNIKPNPSVVSSGCRESLRNSNMPTKCSKEDNLLAITDEPARHCKESVPTKRVTFGKLPKPGVSSGGRTQQFCLETPPAKQLPFGELSKDGINSGDTSKPVKSFPTEGSGADYGTEPQPKNIDSKGTASPNITIVPDRYLPNHPGASPLWKGTFDVMNFRKIEHIQAHPPCKVHNNVYMFSQKLPKSVQFEMLPQHNYWVNIFEGDVPCELDIGLYFLPTSGHEQGYSSLVMLLDDNDLLLRSVIDEVELLIFSSKHLAEKSREINQKHFLWGLCLCRDSETISPAQPLSVSEDMDVDMLGGQEAGSVDVVVPKPTENSEATGAAIDFSPTKAQEELNDDKEDVCLQFERELQKSFDRFAKLMEQKEAKESFVVKEVKIEAELYKGSPI